MSAVSQRARILEATKTQVNENFGPASSLKYFREVVRGPWQPGGSLRPKCWICDDGQSAGDANDVDVESQDRILKVKLVIDLADVLNRESVISDWSDRVEAIVLNLQNHLAAGCGVLRCNYAGDDPFDVIIGQAKTQAVWIIEFEIKYFVEVGALKH
jgi:hypothetical protein